MIIWLASYPRSGNTLLRMIFKQAFGVGTYSRYDDRNDIGCDDATSTVVGHQPLGGVWADRYSQLCADEQVHLVKTHDFEPDNNRCIYIVREGLAAVQSYQKYLQDFRGESRSLEELIVGTGRGFSSWGSHLDRWDPLNRPNTLLLKYEELATDARRAIERISRFCELPVVGQWHNDFDRLHAVNPRFFRQGQARGEPPTVSPAAAALFAALHGDWLQMLGYPLPVTSAEPCMKTIRNMVEHALQEMRELLAAEKKNGTVLKTWAETAQSRCTAQAKLIRELQEWAQSAEARFAAERQVTRDLRERLQPASAPLDIAKDP